MDRRGSSKGEARLMGLEVGTPQIMQELKELKEMIRNASHESPCQHLEVHKQAALNDSKDLLMLQEKMLSFERALEKHKEITRDKEDKAEEERAMQYTQIALLKAKIYNTYYALAAGAATLAWVYSNVLSK